MAKKIKIDFQKGGRFVATLLEKEAPKTCKKIWQALPLEGDVRRSAFSGLVMLLFTDIKIMGFENAKSLGLVPGDIVYWLNIHKLPLKNQINLVFGPAAMRDWCGYSPANHFARITEGSLDELSRIGLRIWDEGKEKVVLSRTT